MKKILITGANSYIGVSFEDWMKQHNDECSIDTIDMQSEKWKGHDFSNYDAVFHVAGIAHVSADPKLEDLYYKVNRDLTIEVAKKAKNEGVRQFVFMSSIIVYGDSSHINKKRVINKDTVPTPSNFYGNSKLQAEEGILPLSDDKFKVAVLRPPMIYGKGSKGNYPKLAKMARKLPIFPYIDNERSMLHIDNLCEFIRLIIKNEESGVFYPQNKEYVKTSDLVKEIAKVHGKNIKTTKIFNPVLRFMGNWIVVVNKAFGNLVYEKSMSEYIENYIVTDFKSSIKSVEDEKIDILLLSDNNLLTVGGEQESTKIIIKGVEKKYKLGVIQPGEIEVRNTTTKYYFLTNYTRIKHLIKNPFAFIRYILLVRRVIIRTKPQIIHTQAQVSFFIVTLLKKINLISSECKLIHTERGLYKKYNKVIREVFIFCMKNLDILVTTTEFNMNSWKKALKEKNIKVIYRIIENTAGELFEIYDPNKVDSDKNKLTIGFSGRYCEWKNWPLALEIVKRSNDILGDKLNVKMTIGCLDNKSTVQANIMFSELKRELGDRFNGIINATMKEMDEFYYGVDIFILTSKFNTESFGRTLVEAMSRGTAVLTTNAGGPVEVVGDSRNVCKDADEFVERIMSLYNDRNLLNLEKSNNLERVKEKYSLKNNINKHLDIYKFIECNTMGEK